MPGAISSINQRGDRSKEDRRQLKRKAGLSNLSRSFTGPSPEREIPESWPLTSTQGSVLPPYQAREEVDHSQLTNVHSLTTTLPTRSAASCFRNETSHKQTRVAPDAFSSRRAIVNPRPAHSLTFSNPSHFADSCSSGVTAQGSCSWPLVPTESSQQSTLGSDSTHCGPSLSRFPLPPPENDSTAGNSSQDSRKTIEPKTPVIYHTRGASFEFLNPRESLRLERIDGPTGHFTKSADYATILRTHFSEDTSLRSPLVLDQEQYGIAIEMERPHTTPPRSLFDDLHTAYSSITSRTVQQLEKPCKSEGQNPLPSVILPVRGLPKSSNDPPVSPSDTTEQVVPLRPLRALSRKKRLSNLWHARRSNGSPAGRDFDSELGHDEAEALVLRQKESAPAMKIDFRRSVSEAELLQNQSLQTSPHTFRPATPNRKSILDLSNLDPSSPESKMRNMIEREESTEAILSAYQYTFSEAALAEQESKKNTSTIPEIQLDPPHEDIVTYSADSTIGDILEDYHRADDSCTIPEEFLAVDGDTRQFSQTSPYSFRTSSGLTRLTDNQLEHWQDASNNSTNNPFTPQGTDVRNATAQALKGLPRAGPSKPLPKNPLKASVFDHKDEQDWIPSTSPENSSPFSSYGDTRNLFQSPSEPAQVEFGRGTGSSKLHLSRDHYSSSESLLAPVFKSRQVNDASFAAADTRSGNLYNRDDVDNMITHDIRHLSGLSGISGLSGSIYVLQTSSSDIGDLERDMEPSEYLDESSKPEVDRRNSAGINYVPQVAAFSPKAVKAGVRRLHSSETLAGSSENDQRSTLSLSTRSSSSHFDLLVSQEDKNYLNKDEDWETLPETRDTRNTFMTGSSWEDCSSLGSVNNLSAITLDRRGTNRQSTDRAHRLILSERSTSLRQNDSQPEIVIPQQNAADISTPGVYQYRHPSPLPQAHENPFTSSPPPLIPSDSKNPSPASVIEQSSIVRDSTPSGVSNFTSPYQWRRQNLSVVYEATGESSGTETPTRRPVTNVGSDQNLSSGNDIRSYTSSAVLGSEPGPELSSEAVHGSPYDLLDESKKYRQYGLTTTDMSLVKKLRQKDHRMASSPLSDDNSFAKFARLGPRLNVTGTPNGTGMRETGSSVVGSSSPLKMTSSPPQIVTPFASPLTIESPTPGGSEMGNGNLEPKSPLADYGKQTPGFQRTESAAEDVVVPKRPRSVLKRKTGSRGKASVSGQRDLMPLGLTEEVATSITTPKRAFFERGPYAVPAGQATDTHNSALARFDIEEFSLKGRYRSPSSQNSATKTRKTTISWVVFAVCALFPPMLVVYGLGYLDPGVAYLSNDSIRHFGRRPKTVAKWLGIVLTIAVIGTIAIFWIVIKSVPNTLPRN